MQTYLQEKIKMDKLIKQLSAEDYKTRKLAKSNCKKLEANNLSYLLKQIEYSSDPELKLHASRYDKQLRFLKENVCPSSEQVPLTSKSVALLAIFI